jgi:hypothetical protein
MTPNELYDALARLLPSQLYELVHLELDQGRRSHVPPTTAPQASRAEALVALAEQDPSLRPRMEAASGTLTSQFCGNVYLNELDHLVCRALRVPCASGTWTTSRWPPTR